MKNKKPKLSNSKSHHKHKPEKKKQDKKSTRLKEAKFALKIETSLEAVRTRALAMKERADMVDICKTISFQLGKLGVSEIRNVQTAVFYVDRGTYINFEYYALHNKSLITEVEYTNHPMTGEFAKQMLQGSGGFYRRNLTGKDLKSWYQFQQTTNQFADPQLEIATSLNYYWYSLGPVALGISTYEPLRKNDIRLFRHFIRVFELSYRRYLDIEISQVQTKEARVEAALERVRSHSMAMQKSEDLKEVIQVVYDQIVDLNINIDHTGFVIDYEPNGNWNFWIADHIGSPTKLCIPNFDALWMNQFMEAKEKGIDFFATHLNFEEKNKFYQDLFRQAGGGISEDTKEWIFARPGLDGSTVLMDNVSLYMENFSGIPYTNEENGTLMRFGNVFQQTYTRFLDLQKSEAQSREAHIELALEKVRARTIAMHRSEEIQEILGKILNEMRQLDKGFESSLIWIINGTERFVTVYQQLPGIENGLTGYRMDYSEQKMFKSLLEAWHRRDSMFVYELKGDDKANWLEYVLNETAMRNISAMAKQRMLDTEMIYESCASNDFGILLAVSFEPLSDENKNIARRFSNVFQQSYTRFVDIQKAEAQARESQIQLALERVRARTMAMQKSNELAETAAVLFQQLNGLEIQSERIFIGIIDDDKRRIDCWGTEQGGNQISMTFEVDVDATFGFRTIYKAWLDKKRTVTVILKGKDLLEHIHYVRDIVGMPVREELLQEQRILYNAFFSKGLITVITPENQSDETLNILERFAGVFSLTYTRFLDIQKAEASAKEAFKQAALDRIRADIASMRTVSDLDRITPLIWNELTVLGIPFVRCGVFIMDDEQQQIQTFLSTPEGRAIAAFRLPYDTPGNFAEIVNHWRQSKNYVNHWQQKDFLGLADALILQGALQNREQYTSSIPTEGTYLHFLPFVQGMLYVGNIARLTEEQIQLIHSVADAFSTAYARYQDFNRLEAAKQQVEKALVDLKQAQQQLVQAEKMASLGELTAGIAHEIQNPLNFVNNFSEVNNELIEELMKERTSEQATRNAELESELLNDIKQNLEKINYHGMRADSIVKGMLQHSRASAGQQELTDINGLAEEYLRLAYHGFRAKETSFNAKLETDFDKTIGKISLIPQDIGRVLLNLINNAFYSVNEKKKTADSTFEPAVKVSTKQSGEWVSVYVSDNGYGISKNIIDKIFQPFFTTKPSGSGTGLGLSLTYDIIKAHGGEIAVESKEGEGSVFIIRLPTVKNM